jgi:hypothetical protein
MSIRMVTAQGRSAPKRGVRARTRTALVPAAARSALVLTAEEQQLSGDAIETFAAAVGGRKKLLETLSIADADNTTDKVVNCLLDPAYQSWSLRRICAYAGITVADLFASYKRALFTAAHIAAAHLITEKLPPIVADVMARALPGTESCPRCKGAPTTPGLTACPLCDGAGTVPTEPDLDRQKLALELGRLTERRAGIVMQQTTAVAAGTAALQSSATGSLEQLQQAVGELLFAPSRRRAAAPVIDVVSTEGPEPAAQEADDDHVSP